MRRRQAVEESCASFVRVGLARTGPWPQERLVEWAVPLTVIEAEVLLHIGRRLFHLE